MNQQNKKIQKKKNKKSKPIKYSVAVPFFSGDYRFDIERKTGWSIIDYLFLKELYNKSMTLAELSDFSNLQKQIVLQILLPMCDVGWINIVSQNNDFIFEVTELGKKTFLSSQKDCELPFLVISYQRKREIHRDIYDNYYNFFKKDIPIVTKARYNEIKKSRTDTDIIELTVENKPLFADSEKVEKAGVYENETVISVLDTANIQFSEKYLLVDMIYTKDNKAKILNTFRHILNDKLIKQIESIEPPSVNNTSEQSQSIMVETDRKPCEISSKVHRDNVDFIYGGTDTQNQFIELINNASNFLIIHSTFIGKWCIGNQKDGFSKYFLAMEKALDRGVLIHILWGKTSLEADDEGYETSNKEDEDIELLLRSFNEYCKNKDMINTIDYNQFRRTESHVKFIITEHTVKGTCVMLSSCNFLFSQYNRYEASVVIYDNVFAKQFLEVSANICSGKNAYDSRTRQSIRNYANAIIVPSTKRQLHDSEKLTVNLILKSQHYNYIDLARKQAKSRIYITSDLINSTPKRPIYEALKHCKVKKRLYYSKSSAHINSDEINKTMNELDNLTHPIRLRKSEQNVHAKVLAWDNNDILITSLNWLSSNASPSSSQLEEYHEIGVHVNGYDVAKEFIKPFRQDEKPFNTKN